MNEQVCTVTLLADNTCVQALFAVADTIKESSIQAIADLKASGVSPVMLKGDNTATAKAIAAQAGIADARGDLLPEAKLQAIKEMQQRYGATGMTGDGIHDAPALAQADIGFAMGVAGTDTAMEAADVVIMNDNLQRVAETVRLSKRTHSILWQNITLALGIKSVFWYWRFLARQPCGWRCLPTWGRVCWWWVTGFVCCAAQKADGDTHKSQAQKHQ